MKIAVLTLSVSLPGTIASWLEVCTWLRIGTPQLWHLSNGFQHLAVPELEANSGWALSLFSAPAGGIQADASSTRIAIQLYCQRRGIASSGIRERALHNVWVIRLNCQLRLLAVALQDIKLRHRPRRAKALPQALLKPL